MIVVGCLDSAIRPNLVLLVMMVYWTGEILVSLAKKLAQILALVMMSIMVAAWPQPLPLLPPRY